MRIILFAGKGGVGKTTISLSTAILSSHLGYKTLIVSTDIAHNLSDALDVNIGSEVKKISTNLHCQEIDTQVELKRNWSLVKGHASAFLTERGLNKLLAEEVAIIPGLEEVFSLLQLKEHYSSGKYEVIILDTAPTSSSLRLLSFPEVMGFWAKNIFGVMDNKISRSLFKITSFFPWGSKVNKISKSFTTVKSLYTKIKRLKKIMQDQNTTSVRLVINPEKMVILETQRLLTYLCLFGISTDAVIVNKIIPSSVSSTYFRDKIARQEKYRKEIKESFSPLPILDANLQEREVLGEKAFLNFAQKIYKEINPTSVLHKENYLNFQKEGDFSVVSLKLPHLLKEKLNVIPRKDGIIVNVGEYKQNIILPDSFKRFSIAQAKFENERLKIYFKKEAL